MRQIEHYIQDACELLAVAEMQRIAESLGLSKKGPAAARREDFGKYVRERAITAADFAEYPEYRANIDKHIGTFVQRIAQVGKLKELTFHCTERESRNNSLKGDFVVEVAGQTRYSVSLKNYRNSIARPQVSAGTFNSIALSFLLEAAPGVGMYVNPTDRSEFRGSTKSVRDSVLKSVGHGWAIPILGKLDDLSQQIRDTFVRSADFEFLDESAFDRERKRVGKEGAEIVYQLLTRLPGGTVRDQIVDRIGFSGTEEQLMFDPVRYTDSITVPRFRDLIEGVRSGADFSFQIHGQGIRFQFTSNQKTLLSITVPFTINKNGAWISEHYPGNRLHPKEGVYLASGQRRPKKSKELATSVNTYLDLEATGIFLRG